MFEHIARVLCRFISLVEKAIDDDHKTARLIAIALALAAVYMLRS